MRRGPNGSHATAVVIGLTRSASPGRRDGTDPQDFTQDRTAAISELMPLIAAPVRRCPAVNFAGGRASKLRSGLIAPNITPDPETGIGAWTDEICERADQRYRSQRHSSLSGDALHLLYRLHATMPWRSELISTPSRRFATRCRSNQLPFPFDTRGTMEAWNKLYFRPGTIHPRAENRVHHGIAALTWLRAPLTAACAIHRRTFWAPMKRASVSRATHCRGGSPRTLPTPRGAGSAAGRSPTLSNI